MAKKVYPTWRRVLNAIFHTFFIFFIIIGGLVIFHNVYYTPVKIVGRSMEPTLQDAEFGVMDTHQWRLEQIERFDIVIVQPSLATEKYIIKRVIGLPGERVVLDGNGELFVNQTHIPQSFLDVNRYLLETCSSHSSIGCFNSIILADNQFYVLGDNRGNSYDSRAMGPFETNQIVGVLFSIEGTCEPNGHGSDVGVTLQTCAVRNYRWPRFY